MHNALFLTFASVKSRLFICNYVCFNYYTIIFYVDCFIREMEFLIKTDAISKMCRATVKHTGSTINLTTHLKQRHCQCRSCGTA